MTITHGADETATHENDSIEKRLQYMDAQLIEIRQTLDAIQETLVRAGGTIDKVASEVMPTLNSLLESPMLKMFLPKQKKV